MTTAADKRGVMSPARHGGTPSRDAASTWRSAHDRVIVYDRVGQGGHDIVIVHGLGMGRAAYGELVAELAARHTVYALDLPGFGDAPTPRQSMSMADTGDLLAEFVAGMGLRRPVLLGHSMGTQVVVEAVARHPDLTDRIVLAAPTIDPRTRRPLRQAALMAEDLWLESPTVLLTGLSQYVRAGPRWFVTKLRWMLDHEVERLYPDVTADALVLRGEFDKVCPRPWVRKVAESMPRAIYREVPGRRHETMMRDARPVAELVTGFLTER